MRVLVTGGAGFVGSAIVDTLLGAGHDVQVVDNLASGRAENLGSDVPVERLDLRVDDLAAAFRRSRPEVVVHQAAQASVPASVADPSHDAAVNIVGSVRVLEAARGAGVRKVVYAASGGSMYGSPLYLPIDEKHPAHPISPYAVSKHTVEHYLEVFAGLFGLAYTSLRYANVYGPRQDPNGEAGVIAIFASRMLGGEQPVINGAGSDQRDYVYVGDIARANLLALERGDGQCLNVGTGVGTDVVTIFEQLAALTGYTGPRVHGPARAGDVPSMYLDPSRAADVLGWRPTVALADGLRQTVEWFRERAGSSGRA